MLRMVQSVNASSAMAYFKAELSSGAYYTKDAQTKAGRWGGKTAKALGLEGEIDERDFAALCSNAHPETGEPLTPRTKDGRTVGYDITFNAPKSVTLAYELGGDKRILDAFERSVRTTMERIESETLTRVRTGGKNEERQTGNLAWGEFTHFTARPVDGLPDPHLHTHVYAFNLTHDEVEGRFKAVQFRETKRDMPLHQADFLGHLAASLKELGYGIRQSGSAFEIEGISDDLIRRFSRRTSQIESLAELQEGLSEAQKAQIGPQSREVKKTGLSMSELRGIWRERLKPEEAASFEAARAAPQEEASRGSKRTPETALDFVLRRELERASAIEKNKLLVLAMREGFGSFTLDELQSALERRRDLVFSGRGQKTFVTTKPVLNEERAMVDFARSGINRRLPMLSLTPLEGKRLSSEQRDAVNHILGSTDRVVAVTGRAGTGKTTMMQSAVRALNMRMARMDGVAVLAPTSEAARGVLRSEGFKRADTVAKFLSSKSFQDRYSLGAIWVDEAGLLSVEEMNGIFAAARRLKARVILSGDTGQHNAVARGDALRILQREAGLKPAVMSEIHRQQNPLYKDAVEALSRGDASLGATLLEKQGAFVEVSGKESATKLSADYLAAIERGETALVVSPTHEEGRIVTSKIRADLVRQGKLGAGGHVFERYLDLQLTTAEKRERSPYVAGRVLRFHRSTTGFVSGDTARVIGSPVKGFVVAWDPQRWRYAIIRTGRERVANSFSVNDTEKIEVRRGDVIQFTTGGATISGRHKVNNRATYRVKAIIGPQLLLENGWRVDARKGNFTHGYVTTSHGSQGKTVDRVFIAQSSRSRGAASKEQFYVSASRARKSVRVYTDDVARLKRDITRSNERMSAHQVAELAAHAKMRERSRTAHAGLEHGV